MRARAIPERLRGVITTRRYTNPRLPLPLPLVFLPLFPSPPFPTAITLPLSLLPGGLASIITLSVELRTCDQEVVGSSLNRALRRKKKLWASFSHLCASVTKQYDWSKGGCLATGSTDKTVSRVCNTTVIDLSTSPTLS